MSEANNEGKESFLRKICESASAPIAKKPDFSCTADPKPTGSAGGCHQRLEQ